MSCNSEDLPYSTEETYVPIIDSLGPFHDETILSSIDKLLYLLGVQNMAATTTTKSILKVRRCGDEDSYQTCDTCRSGARCNTRCASPTCAFPSRTQSNSNCGLSKTSLQNISSTTKTIPRCAASHASLPQAFLNSLPMQPPTAAAPTKQAAFTPTAAEESSLASSVRFLEHPLVKELICPICGGVSGKPDTSKLEDMIKNYEDYQRSPIKTTLRHSLAYCSQAVRKLKKVLSESFQIPKMQTDLNWFWTRRREEGGHHILEIYENSDLSKHPSQTRLRENLSLILVVTPSGIVMPFEPVQQPN